MNGVLRYLMTRTWMSVVGLLAAVVVAIPTYIYLGHRLLCSGLSVHQGGNIDRACLLVAIGGVAALGALYPIRNDGRALAGMLLLGAVVLGSAIGLVAADSATHVATWSEFGLCRNSDDPYRPEVQHVAWLYAAWGVPLALMVLRAFGAWTGMTRPEPEPRPELSS